MSDHTFPDGDRPPAAARPRLATAFGHFRLPPSRQVSRRGSTLAVDVVALTADGYDRLRSLLYSIFDDHGSVRLSFRRFGPVGASWWWENPWFNSHRVLPMVLPDTDGVGVPGAFAMIDLRDDPVCDCPTFHDAQDQGWHWWEPDDDLAGIDRDDPMCALLGDVGGCFDCDRCTAREELERFCSDAPADAVCIVFVDGADEPLLIDAPAPDDVDLFMSAPYAFARTIGPVEARVRDLVTGWVRIHRRVPERVAVGAELWQALRDEFTSRAVTTARPMLLPVAPASTSQEPDEVVVEIPRQYDRWPCDRATVGYVPVPHLGGGDAAAAMYAQLRSEGTPAAIARDIVEQTG